SRRISVFSVLVMTGAAAIIRSNLQDWAGLKNKRQRCRCQLESHSEIENRSRRPGRKLTHLRDPSISRRSAIKNSLPKSLTEDCGHVKKNHSGRNDNSQSVSVSILGEALRKSMVGRHCALRFA